MSLTCLGLEVLLLGARLCFGDPAPRRTVQVCPVVVPRNTEWQRALRAERLYAAASPRTDEAVSEWLSLRDQARACRQN